MATCKGWTKKSYLEEFWNGAHLENKEREDLEICGFRRLQQEWERGELATWNGSTEKGGERKLIYFRHGKIWKHQESIYKINSDVFLQISRAPGLRSGGLRFESRCSFIFFSWNMKYSVFHRLAYLPTLSFWSTLYDLHFSWCCGQCSFWCSPEQYATDSQPPHWCLEGCLQNAQGSPSFDDELCGQLAIDSLSYSLQFDCTNS